jgi:hypothetical protein
LAGLEPRAVPLSVRSKPVSLSLYQASVPVFIRSFDNLNKILDKAIAHAEAKKIDQSVFVTGRLAPDMLPFSKQIQIASDTAKGAAARLGGLEIPSFADTETTFDELKDRIARTVTFMRSADAAKIDASSEREIVLKMGKSGELKFSGNNYLLGFVLPNFYFHITTAYLILRHNGVEIGKLDYLGALDSAA